MRQQIRLSHRIKGGVNMKMKYETPIMELIKFEIEDIVVTSYNPEEDSTEIIPVF